MVNQENIDFINENKEKSVAALALLLSKKPELDKTFILNQVNGWQKAKQKLPEFFNTNNIIFPSSRAMEQCSSEETAIYKNQLVSGKNLLDLTGGFGIDSYYFSKKFENITYIEQNKELLKIAEHNFRQLNATNIQVQSVSAEQFLDNNQQTFDVVYIDPDRRNEQQRLYQLLDCSPNIIEILPKLFKITDKVLIKTSPFLDISKTISELKQVEKCVVVAVKNECKEVLYLLSKSYRATPKIVAVNLGSGQAELVFTITQEKAAKVVFSKPLNYLYEPNAAIMKSGGFNIVAEYFKVKKIAPQSHLYTSDELIHDFPGRIFKITFCSNYNQKEFAKSKVTKASVTLRNFPDSIEKLKTKLRLKDGGTTYLFGTSKEDNHPIIIVAEKCS